MWAALLVMTNGEVDRAMVLEETLTEEWYYRWVAYTNEVSKK